MPGTRDPLPAETARDVTALLVRGYNEHIRLGGQGGSTAAGRPPHQDIIVLPADDSYGFTVRRDGREVAVLVITPGPGQTALGILHSAGA